MNRQCILSILVTFLLTFSITGCRGCSCGSHAHVKNNIVDSTEQSEDEKTSENAFIEDELENIDLIPALDILTPEINKDDIILTRAAYILSYDNVHKIPKWVAWHLTSNHTDGPVTRKGYGWHEDNDVEEPRVSFHDFSGSGWSRGHMCPAADNKWSRRAMDECFLTTNCCAQNRNMNSGTWNQIEISSRRWAEKYGDVYIVCGPILYNQEHEIIGENKVTVPEAFFKVILRLGDAPKAIGFICKNTDGNKKKDFYVNSLKQVERITGLTFFPTLSQEIKEQIYQDADISSW